jgi:serine/threonine protein kinase, bacterial
VLPFTGLDWPWGVAVDSTGNLYVTESRNNRVLKLAAG